MKLVGIVGAVLTTIVCVTFANDAIEAFQGSDTDQETAVSLNGLWLSNCFEFEPGVYQVRTFEFVLDHLATITTMTYPDALCEQSPIDSNIISATWDLGEAHSTEEGLSAYQLEVLLKAGRKQELTTVKQIVYLQQNQFNLGINKKLDVYPEKLDWAITYSLINP